MTPSIETLNKEIERLNGELAQRDAHIVKLQILVSDTKGALDEIERVFEEIVKLWEIQQIRLAILENAVRGPKFPDTK